jgi:hypothetical protein
VYKPPAQGNFYDEHGEHLNLPLLKTTVSKWATSTRGREWLIAIQLVREHGRGQKIIFFASWI